MSNKSKLQGDRIDEYVVEISGEITVSSAAATNTTEAASVAQQRIQDGEVTPDINIVDVTGVNDFLGDFIVEFGDGGDAPASEDTEWIINKEEIIGWIPPEETELCGVPIGEYRSTTSIQRGKKKTDHESQIRKNAQEVIYRLADQNDTVIKFIDNEYMTVIAELFEMDVTTVINQSFITDENELILVKPPAPGWVVIAPLEKVSESAYLWETIVFDGQKTGTAEEPK